jgi:acetyltransferase-like isoleucine patch superfamily enzyme
MQQEQINNQHKNMQAEFSTGISSMSNTCRMKISMKDAAKKFIRNGGILPRIIVKLYNTFLGGNKFIIRGSHPRSNAINIETAILKKVRIEIHGNDNHISLRDGCRLNSTRITVYGSHNRIIVGKLCSLLNTSFCIEDDNNIIELGERTTLCGTTELASIEGCKITIGTDCMFSRDIILRTGDSHSVVNLSGGRINASKDISIGNHVWLGTHVIITKGVKINDDSIVGAGAVVTKPFDEKNIVLAGNPARTVKRDISWKRERI